MNADVLAPLRGAVTGIGSHPGIDPLAAAGTVVGELAVPYLPELPARGIGADMIGRSAGLLVDFGVDTSTTGYRVGMRSGHLARTIADLLERDLDAFEQAYEEAGRRGGGLIKTQAAGPLTLGGSLELPTGHRVAKDRGAWRDLAASLAEGLARHVADLRRRCGADVVVQLDEPLLLDAVRGTLPALTRLDPIRALPAPDAAELLATVIDGVDAPVLLHLCGGIDWNVIDRVGAAGVLTDLTGLTSADFDGVGALVERGGVLGLGAVPAVSGSRPPDVRRLVAPAVAMFDSVGLSRAQLAATTVTPTCGLAGTQPDRVRPVIELCRRASELLHQV